MKIFAKSDIGRARELNEDFYYISKDDDEIKLFILADGMGGYNGGEVASRLAVETTKKYILDRFDKVKSDRDQILILVKEAVIHANTIVYEKAKHTQGLEAMGTTIDVALIYNNKIFISHVGDSRIYRIRKAFIRKLTKDHNYPQQLIEEGKITKEEAISHPKKNMLTKAVGCTKEIQPDAMIKGFIKDDILIMCSDGLTNMLTEQQLYNITKENPEDATNMLVEEANKLGGYDNITVIIIM